MLLLLRWESQRAKGGGGGASPWLIAEGSVAASISLEPASSGGSKGGLLPGVHVSAGGRGGTEAPTALLTTFDDGGLDRGGGGGVVSLFCSSELLLPVAGLQLAGRSNCATSANAASAAASASANSWLNGFLGTPGGVDGQAPAGTEDCSTAPTSRLRPFHPPKPCIFTSSESASRQGLVGAGAVATSALSSLLVFCPPTPTAACGKRQRARRLGSQKLPLRFDGCSRRTTKSPPARSDSHGGGDRETIDKMTPPASALEKRKEGLTNVGANNPSTTYVS
mmetsp:Transcript_68222/g.142577  ORF Transcript_68222/g.142577 Transcript_68222/m.142577 type:complete len:280 (+) Transcript_68222:1156-1995(+)